MIDPYRVSLAYISFYLFPSMKLISFFFEILGIYVIEMIQDKITISSKETKNEIISKYTNIDLDRLVSM